MFGLCDFTFRSLRTLQATSVVLLFFLFSSYSWAQKSAVPAADNINEIENQLPERGPFLDEPNAKDVPIVPDSVKAEDLTFESQDVGTKPLPEATPAPTPKPITEKPKEKPSALKAAQTTTADKPVPGKTQFGKVIHPGSLVYKNSDFDAPVIAKLAAGKMYLISNQIVGAFYKIKIKDGVYGYIADTDIRPVTAESEKKLKNTNNKKNKTSTSKSKKQKAFEFQKYRGLQISQITFKEDTMSVDPKENLTFFGFRVSGPDILVEGSYVDSTIQIHLGAPQYYEKATKKSADGLILLMDFKWQTVFPQGKNTMLYFGFGPMLKYSQFRTALNVSGKEEAYDLVDMSVGAALDLGITQRFEQFALRGEILYYWEKTQYSGLALSAQLPF